MDWNENQPNSTNHERRNNMTYENYKTGMLRVFIVLSIPLVLVTYFEYDLSFTNKFFYSVEILFQTLVIFGCIYLFSLLIIKPFIK
jgi:hypothetical protein